PSSQGLQSVADGLRELRTSAEFEALERELPRLRKTLGSVRSVTVGVNLGPDLAPESATILELGTTPVEGRRGLLWRLLGADRVGQLGAELGLLLGVVRLFGRLARAGLPICRPVCLPMDDRRAHITDAYEVGLALRELDRSNRVVTNLIEFGSEAGRVWVLTG